MNNLTVGHWSNQWPQMHHVKVTTWSISWSFMISPSNFSITAIMSVAQIFGTRGSKFDVNFVKSLNLSFHSSPFRTESFTVVLETLVQCKFHTIFKPLTRTKFDHLRLNFEEKFCLAQVYLSSPSTWHYTVSLALFERQRNLQKWDWSHLGWLSSRVFTRTTSLFAPIICKTSQIPYCRCWRVEIWVRKWTITCTFCGVLT